MPLFVVFFPNPVGSVYKWLYRPIRIQNNNLNQCKNSYVRTCSIIRHYTWIWLYKLSYRRLRAPGQCSMQAEGIWRDVPHHARMDRGNLQVRRVCLPWTERAR
jgi:hypothetical protein